MDLVSASDPTEFFGALEGILSSKILHDMVPSSWPNPEVLWEKGSDKERRDNDGNQDFDPINDEGNTESDEVMDFSDDGGSFEEVVGEVSQGEDSPF